MFTTDFKKVEKRLWTTFWAYRDRSRRLGEPEPRLSGEFDRLERIFSKSWQQKIILPSATVAWWSARASSITGARSSTWRTTRRPWASFQGSSTETFICKSLKLSLTVVRSIPWGAWSTSWWAGSAARWSRPRRKCYPKSTVIDEITPQNGITS